MLLIEEEEDQQPELTDELVATYLEDKSPKEIVELAKLQDDVILWNDIYEMSDEKKLELMDMETLELTVEDAKALAISDPSAAEKILTELLYWYKQGRLSVTI